MGLEPGAKLGQYEILGPLGAGGMGEVYRARDSRLGREVAIKVLPSEVARDAERLARFRREATLLASLNHPQIASIHGLEESDGSPFLVLELVEGEDLSERLKRGPIPAEEAVGIARQIAEALEEAHEKEIVHRDLKPGNVKLTPDGKVKVLDFGLAKAYSADAASDAGASVLTQSPTLAHSGTAAGVILGTAGYMSPEQAAGKAVDKRADVWAFGVVLFEMLTGRRAFAGETVSETLASVMKDEPDWDRLPSDCPPGVIRLLHRCLRKKPVERLRDVGDARLELAEATGEPIQEASGRPRRAWIWGRSAMTAVALALAALAGWSLSGRDASHSRVARLTVTLPSDLSVSIRGYPTIAFALSPDGEDLVFVGQSSQAQGRDDQLYVRSLGAFGVRPLAGTAPADQPFYSPDGRWVGFFSDGRLRKVSLEGGSPVTILDEVPRANWAFGSWGADDTIVFSSDSSGISRIDAGGGRPEIVTRLDTAAGELAHEGPRFLPGAQAVVFQVTRSSKKPRIDVVHLDNGERYTLVENASRPLYAAPARLLFVRDGGLMAVPFDPVRLEVTGRPVPIAERVRLDDAGVPQMDTSAEGTLVYVSPVMTREERALMWVTPEAEVELLPAPRRAYQHPRLSPDGRFAAVVVEDGPDRQQIHLYDMSRRVLTQLTDVGWNASPVWTPDGTRVVFWSRRRGDRAGIYGQPVGGSTAAEMLLATERETESLRPGTWSPDGTQLVYTVEGAGGADIWVAALTDDGVRTRPLLDGPADERNPMLSPDGAWLAYVSSESGLQEVYVQRFPDGGGKRQVSDRGGFTPVWPRGSRSLVYQNYEGIVTVAAATDPELRLGAPAALVERGPSVGPLLGPRTTIPYAIGATHFGPTFDVAPDGDRLLMVYQPEDPWLASEVRVVLNWSEELEANRGGAAD